LKEVMQEKNKLQATINDAKKRRIKDIDIEIKPGEFVFMIGYS